MSYMEIRSPLNPRKVDSAEDLWSLFLEYIKHSDDNPLVEAKLFNAKEGLREGKLNKLRPYTLVGFCSYVGINTQTLWNWEKQEKKIVEENDDLETTPYLSVIKYIKEVINNQQYQGAAAGLLNAAMVKPYIGLVDKQELHTDHTSSDGSMAPKGLDDFYQILNGDVIKEDSEDVVEIHDT